MKPTTRDEVGLLTRTFNEMVVGLRERLHLTRYVGTHTLDMIQATSNSDAVDLGVRAGNWQCCSAISAVLPPIA